MAKEKTIICLPEVKKSCDLATLDVTRPSCKSPALFSGPPCYVESLSRASTCANVDKNETEHACDIGRRFLARTAKRGFSGGMLALVWDCIGRCVRLQVQPISRCAFHRVLASDARSSDVCDHSPVRRGCVDCFVQARKSSA